MSLQSIAHAIEMLPLMTAVRESTDAYPIILSLHLTGIALGGGLVLMTDLRLLGLALKEYPVTDVVKGLRPFKHVLLTIIVTCGLLLGTSKAEEYSTNPYFWIKMMMLCLAIVHAIVFKKSVYKNTEELDRLSTPSSQAKAAAIGSLLIWLIIPCMGRLIGYWD